MKLVESVRSWSFPPAYSDVPQNELPTRPASPLRPPTTTASRPRLSAYLLCFERQWLLVHVLAIFSAVATMFVGVAVFIGTGSQLLPGGHGATILGWLTAASGIICTIIGCVAFQSLNRLDRLDLTRTREQQGTRRFITTVCTVLGQAAVVTIQIAMSRLNGAGVLVQVAVCAIVCNSMAIIYDIIRSVRIGRERDDDWEADDLDNEMPPSTGAVRL